MPQATDLTVQNGAPTPADKTFSLLTPASGYGSIAEWALKEGVISSVFPRLTAAARPSNNSKAPAKVLQIKLRVPSSYQDAVTGLTNVNSAFEMNATVSVPDDFPEDKKADAVAYATNLLATDLLREMMKDGAPAT